MNNSQKKKINNTNTNKIVKKKNLKKTRKKKKKLKFNLFKFVRNIVILIAAIFIIHWIITPNVKNTAKNIQNTTTPTSVAPAPVQASPATEYKKEQYTQIDNIFRFNQNLYMAMSSNNVVNIYPDSQNGVNKLNSNLTTYANKLNSQTVRDDSTFISELTLKNNAFINAVIAYNNEAFSKNPNQSTLSKLSNIVLTNYNTVNSFMNSNLGLFK